MYDWDRGIGTCMNCSKTFQLHTYKRKGSSEKVYVRPTAPVNTTAPSTKIVEWFKDRAISEETLKELGVTEGPEFMPQTGKNENAIHFNYFIGDQLINVKYRDGRIALLVLSTALLLKVKWTYWRYMKLGLLMQYLFLMEQH